MILPSLAASGTEANSYKSLVDRFAQVDNRKLCVMGGLGKGFPLHFEAMPGFGWFSIGLRGD